MLYKELKTALSDVVQFVRHLETGVVIPFDPANTDYQTYLKWLKEGNTPEAADE